MPSRLRYSEADLTPTTGFDKNRGFWDIDMSAFKSVLEINTITTIIPSKVFGRQMAGFVTGITVPVDGGFLASIGV